MGNPIAHAFAVDEAGNPVALQDHQVAAGVSDITPITPVQASQLTQRSADANYVDQNYGTAGKAGLGFASGLTLGLGPAAMAHMGLLDRGHLEAAEQSGAFGAGDLAGMVAPTLLTGGEGAVGRSAIGKALRFGTPAGLMGEAGGFASRLMGGVLPEAGLMGKALGSSLKMAAQGSTEGALISMAHQASQDIIQNKPLAAQAMMASGVEGALFGGLTGGILGGVGGMIGAAGGRLGRSAGGQGEGAARTALKHIGADAGDFERMGAKDGGVVQGVRDYHDVMKSGGESYASDTSAIHRSAKRTALESATIADDVVSKLQAEHPMDVPNASRVGSRIESETMAHFDGKLEQEQAAKVVKQLRRELEGEVQQVKLSKLTEPVKPTLRDATTRKVGKGTETVSYTAEHAEAMGKYNTAKGAYDTELARRAAAPEVRQGGMKTWEHWADSREMLADRVSKSTGVKQEVYRTALNAFDSELATSMATADGGLAAQFAAANTQKRVANELASMSGRKVAAADPVNPLKVTGGDMGTGGYALFAGANPLIAAGIIAGKKATQYVQQRLEPVIAEYAARSAMGAGAGAAVANVGQRMSSGLKAFIRGGRQGITKVALDASQASAKTKLSYTMNSYQKTMDMADELTSDAHMAKVRDVTQALAAAGHQELAQEMAETYGRAAAYIKHNQPKKGKEHDAGRLGKAAKALSPTTQGMKFMRQMAVLRDPVNHIMDGLANGDLSRDAVAAFKYVFPDMHQDLVYRASQEIMAMKEEGKHLAADKVVMLGTALDATVDSTLQKDYIAEVQQGLAANKKPAPDEGSAPPPATDISSYQTPLQSTV